MRQKISILAIFLGAWLTSNSQATQDSARLKVTKARSGTDHTYYWLKDMDTKEKYYTVCSCEQKHKEGEVVLIARRDIDIISQKLRKQDTKQ